MPQAIAETIFDILYLGFALIMGITMLSKGKEPIVKKAGMMAALLGAGDAFHLIPRSYALWTTGLEANAAAAYIWNPEKYSVCDYGSDYYCHFCQ